MPGSPPISTPEPGTMPPPSTRLSSLMRRAMRGVPSIGTLGSATATPPPPAPLATGMDERVFSGVRRITSSSVFHSSQSGHLPIHFICTLWQFVHW